MFFLPLLMTVRIAASATAEPVVTGVSGTVGHGQSITISGSGFGHKSPVAPLKFDNFDNRGAFAAGSTQYLYVVNRDGVANANGFPIVLATQTGKK